MAFDFQANASLATRAFEACPSRADHTFGPAVAAPCRQGFDFTLMFEQSVLSIGPSSLLLLLVPLRLFWLYRTNVKIVSFRARYTAKAVRQARLDMYVPRSSFFSSPCSSLPQLRWRL
jgi:hypothetical protein